MITTLCLALAGAASLAPDPTRADLAAAYLRFERALRDHPPQAAEREALERGFDAATLSFFTGDATRALERLDDLTASLDPLRGANAAERALDALALDVEPREVLAQAGGELTFRLRRLRPVAGEPRAARVRIVLPHADGPRVLASGQIPDPFGAPQTAFKVRVPGGAAQPAARVDLFVELELDGARPRRVASVALVGEPLSVIQGRTLALLASVEPDGPPLEQALATGRARARLLDARPSAGESARFLLDLAAHASEVEAEARAIAAGSDPYRRRAGHLWRVARLPGGGELPLRVYAPPAACGEARVPLVVAIHGAGGDENMFLEAYGLGKIADLACEHGFVVAAPRAGFAGLSAAAFDAVLEALLYTHPIDVKRVHVVGHSMGAGAAGALRLARAERLASVALLAGAPRGSGGASLPPMYLACGALDPLASAESVRRAGQAARDAGGTVEIEILEGRGHTLFVGDVLPRAIGWCLAHARP